jgi:hypothetical protein
MHEVRRSKRVLKKTQVCVSKTGEQMDEEINSALSMSGGAISTPVEKRDLVPITQGRNRQTVPLADKRVSRRWLKVVLSLAIVIGGAGGGAASTGVLEDKQQGIPPGPGRYRSRGRALPPRRAARPTAVG